MAQILRADGTTAHVQPENGRDFKLAEIKAAIGGGWVEVVYLLDRKHLIACDEEGLLKQLPLNAQASALCRKPIVGDVLYCRISEIT